MLASSTGRELDDFGTAGALVAATVALIKERYPYLSPALAGRALAMSARDYPKGGYAPPVGFGVLDRATRSSTRASWPPLPRPRNPAQAWWPPARTSAAGRPA
jgi:hypothetical protein